MRPFRCAMDLVHTYHGDGSPILGEVLNEEALRRYEKHLNFPFSESLLNLYLGQVTLLRVNGRARDEVWQLLQLVCHEGDQRSDDKDKSWHEHRHVLIDQRLAAAGSQHYQAVLLLLEKDLECL